MRKSERDSRLPLPMSTSSKRSPGQPPTSEGPSVDHARRLPSSRRWLALTILCVPLVIVNLDMTVLNVALPTLVRDLHATSDQLQWIVDAYIIVYAGLVLVAGSLADRVGRKNTFVAGLVAFAVGSGWAALSGSVGVLIAARASMGIGAALMMPSTLAIVTNTFQNPKERQRAIALWSGTSGVGIALGPIIGGLLLAHFWWGSVFLVNVPVAALTLVCAISLVPNSKDPAALASDFSGALLSVVSLVLIVWAIIDAPTSGWSSPVVIGTGLAGLAGLGLFVLWERASPHPMLDLAYFQNRRFTVPVSSVAMAMFGLAGALFVLTQFLQFALRYSPLEAGVRVLPAAGAVAVVAPLSVLLVRAAGTKLTVAAGLLFVAGGLWQISGASASSTFVDVLPGVTMLGIGAGLVIPASTTSIMNSLPSGHTGVGSATNGTFFQIGGALGVAVIGSLLSSRYQARMREALEPFHVPRGVESTILGSLGGAQSVAERVGGRTGQLLDDVARSAFVSGMDLGLVVGSVIAAAGCLLALAALPARPSPERERRGDDVTSGA